MKKLLIGFVLLCIFFPPLGQLAIDKTSNAISQVVAGDGIDDVRGWADQFELEDKATDVAGLTTDLTGEAVVARVVDGDTLTLVGGQVVHLLQIDAPTGSSCHADKATKALAGLVKPGDRVRLARDPALRGQDGTGVLRYVWNETVFLNARLIVVGAVAPYFPEGERGRYSIHFERYARQARDAGLGFWGSCQGVVFDPYRPFGA